MGRQLPFCITKTIIMEDFTEVLISNLTKKENRRNTIKFIGYSLLFGLFGLASMYGFLYFMLWANEITDKILGIS
jgi:hypothetical protein